MRPGGGSLLIGSAWVIVLTQGARLLLGLLVPREPQQLLIWFLTVLPFSIACGWVWGKTCVRAWRN